MIESDEDDDAHSISTGWSEKKEGDSDEIGRDIFDLDSPMQKVKEEAKLFLNEWKEFKNKKKNGVQNWNEVINLGGGVMMNAEDYMAERQLILDQC